MASAGASVTSRRLLIAGLVFGGFVLFDIALFGWLIVRSLSQRELSKILVETRVEAQGLAQRIAGRAQGKDLYTAIALERETQTYIDSVLKQRDIVQTVEIRDRDGTLVLRSSKELSVPLPGPAVPPLAGRDLHRPPEVDKRSFEKRSTYDVTVPIGDLGMLYVGISPGELEQRVGLLRTELIRQATLIGLLTFGLLLSAYVGVWWLWRRGVRLEEQAKEAERMAYIGTLASGLAHEIRNPLNSLSLNMQLLEEEIGESGRTHSGERLLSITKSEIGRLERLVTDFLSYARPRPLDLEPVTVADLLEHARQVVGPQAQAQGVRLEVADSTGGAAVRVDRAQIGQLLLNLAQNALAATFENGPRPALVRILAELDGASVRLAVEDNGEGIAAERQGKIFDLFYSTRKGGTGLGLAIVQRIARAHGTQIEVDSADGKGARMSLELPLAVPRPEPAVRAALEVSAG